LHITGGVAPYVYDWDGDGYDDLKDNLGATAGSYTINIKDNNNCVLDSSITIIEPTELVLSTTKEDERFGSDGSIDLTINGGTLPYSALWDNAATDEDISGLATGSYKVVITDGNGCKDSITTIIESSLAILEEEELTFSLFPNPTDGIVNIKFSKETTGTIQILNAVGKVVYSITKS